MAKYIPTQYSVNLIKELNRDLKEMRNRYSKNKKKQDNFKKYIKWFNYLDLKDKIIIAYNYQVLKDQNIKGLGIISKIELLKKLTKYLKYHKHYE